jgi:hypothetical protein
VAIGPLASPKDLLHDLREVSKGLCSIANERRSMHRGQGAGLERCQPLQRRFGVGCIWQIVRKRSLLILDQHLFEPANHIRTGASASPQELLCNRASHGRLGL